MKSGKNSKASVKKLWKLWDGAVIHLRKRVSEGFSIFESLEKFSILQTFGDFYVEDFILVVVEPQA